MSAGYLLLAKDGDRFRHPIIHVSEISARCSGRRASNLGELLCTLVIYLWLHTDVNSYRIRSFVVAQECPRIDGVRRLMAYSTCVYVETCTSTRAVCLQTLYINARSHGRCVVLPRLTTPSQRGVTVEDSFMVNLAGMLGTGLRCAGSCCTSDALHRSSIQNSHSTVVHVTHYMANVDSWPAEKGTARMHSLLASFDLCTRPRFVTSRDA